MSVLTEGAAAVAASNEKRSYLSADARRAQILDCAIRVFAEKGYHPASIADVCAAAGIGRGTLYQYFDDKSDLLRALTLRVKVELERVIERRAPIEIPKAGLAPEIVIGFVQHRFFQCFEVIFRDAPTARLVLHVGRGSGLLDDLFREIDASILAVMERDLQAGVDAGVLRPVDVKLAARFFLGGIEKVVLSYLDDNRAIDLKRIAREAALLEMRGVLAAPKLVDVEAKVERVRAKPAPSREERSKVRTKKRSGR